MHGIRLHSLDWSHVKVAKGKVKAPTNICITYCRNLCEGVNMSSSCPQDYKTHRTKCLTGLRQSGTPCSHGALFVLFMSICDDTFKIKTKNVLA